MLMFVDREREQASLAARLDEGKPQLLRVYGRRRLGKTELLRRVTEARGGLYLLADEADRPLQLASLGAQVGKQARVPAGPHPHWDAFLDAVEATGRHLVVIDEFQRIIESDPQAVSRLQDRWDRSWSKAGPSLILCGSRVGMMQRLTAGRRGPLFGRLTGDLRLRPFGYGAARLLYPELGAADRVVRYAVFGGTPFYHRWSTGASLEHAVRASFLDATAPLVEEPQELLRSELKAPTRYNSILYEIGQGTHALGELEQKVGVSKGGLSPYLRALREEMDLLVMDEPTCGVQRASRYVFSDPFFSFYYRFVFPHRARLELGGADAVWRDIARDLDGYVGRVFEDVVRQALVAANGTSAKGHRLDFERIGRWWNRAGEELDVVAAGRGEVLAGEVKWSTKPGDLALLRDLERKARLLERVQDRPVRSFLACRAGVTEEAREALASQGGWCWDLDEIERVFQEAQF